MSNSAISFQQPYLIDVHESDDFWLADQSDLLWFQILRDMDWAVLKPVAKQYYQALYDFNIVEAIKREQKGTLEKNQETQQQATLRLLEERATETEDVSPLFSKLIVDKPTPNVDASEIGPGMTPIRFVGRQPKCFFALFKAFVGLTLMGRVSEPETVYQELRNNPSFARTCGFSLPNGNYRQSDIPSLRKLQQFDQIMTEQGLWSHASVGQVKRNLESGRIKPEKILAHHSTHYDAWSSMHTVHKELGNGEIRSKSQSATTKKCRCSDRNNCSHTWQSADEGAGTVTKTGGKMHWAHKASTLGLPDQGILIDAVAMSDAASHDSTSLVPHLGRVFELYPELKKKAKIVVDDAAADDGGLKRQVKEEFNLNLLTPINPKARGQIIKDLPRGISHITPSGIPVCGEGYPFELKGVRKETDKFIFSAPDDENGRPVCIGCPIAKDCYRGKVGARRIEIACERMPWIDPQFPQHSLRFQKIMAHRTVIERLHKLMKYDFGGYDLTKRGNDSFQATLDKTVLGMHLLIEHQ